MRSIWLSAMLGLLIGGCNWNNNTAPPKPGTIDEEASTDASGWVPTGNDDLDTTAISLLDFMKQGRVTALVDGQRSTVVVHKLTNGPSEYISAEQIISETRRMNLPEGVIASLQARNAEPQEVNWIPASLPFFVADLAPLPVDLAEMAEALTGIYPRSFAAVWLWLPGYSEDGLYAIVRFTFAPTRHGAIATYLLVKDDTGKWRILNRGLNYFMAVQP